MIGLYDVVVNGGQERDKLSFGVEMGSPIPVFVTTQSTSAAA
jgi:hypothetical protein